MKKLIASILLGLACAGGTAAAQLVIASSDYPPYVSSKAEDSFLTELFEEIGKEMGVHFDFRLMPWKRCTAALDAAEAWGAAPYIRTPEREQTYLFSDTIYTRKTRLFYYSRTGPRPELVFRGLDDLRQYRIGGVAGYWYVGLFGDAGITLDLAINEERNFEKLQVGRFDFAIADENVAQYLINRRFAADARHFFSMEQPFDTNTNHLMVSRQYHGAEHWLRQFNKALHAVKRNGTFKRIAASHGLPLSQ